MNHIEINVETRDGIGKGFAHRLRAVNRVPGIFYGPHLKDPIAVSVDVSEFSRARTKMSANTIFKIQAADKSPLVGKMALLKSIQTHPVSDKFLHIDFYEVSENEPLKVRVPVTLVGKAIGASEGGILEQLQRDLEIKSLPKDIPTKIEVDISGLNIGESLHVSDVTLPNGVSVVGNVNYTIATVVAPDKEVAKAAAADAAPAAAGKPAAAAAPADEKKADAKK